MTKRRQPLGFLFIVLVFIRERLPFVGVFVLLGVVGVALYLTRTRTPLPAWEAPTLIKTYHLMLGGCEFTYVSDGSKPLELNIVDCECIPQSQRDNTIGVLPDSRLPVYLSESTTRRYVVVGTPPPLRSRNSLESDIGCP